jgi:hypothetical protein
MMLLRAYIGHVTQDGSQEFPGCEVRSIAERELASEGITNVTFITAEGRWQGQHEGTTIVEVFVTDNEQGGIRMAKAMGKVRVLLDQESIMILRTPAVAMMIDGDC